MDFLFPHQFVTLRRYLEHSHKPAFGSWGITPAEWTCFFLALALGCLLAVIVFFIRRPARLSASRLTLICLLPCACSAIGTVIMDALLIQVSGGVFSQSMEGDRFAWPFVFCSYLGLYCSAVLLAVVLPFYFLRARGAVSPAARGLSSIGTPLDGR